MSKQFQVSARVDASDPRPRLIEKDSVWLVAGYACDECGYRLALPRPWCPVCRGPLSERLFGPGGRVWASTTLHVPLPDREPPVTFAYVDVDDGPRVLCHVDGAGEDAGPLPPDTGVKFSGRTEQGDPLVRRQS